MTKQDDSGGPAKPKERQERFEPVQILLVPSGDEWNLVAQDATGAQTGVLCPPAAIDSLRTFVSSPNPHFVEIWRTYERSMGPSVFFGTSSHLLRRYRTSAMSWTFAGCCAFVQQASFAITSGRLA